MKLHPLSALILLLIVDACGIDPYPVEVSVQDRVTQTPLDSAGVVLTRSIGKTQEVIDTLWTNEEGMLSLMLRPEKDYDYSVKAFRMHYEEALSESGADYENEGRIDVLGKSDSLTLYLDPIELPDPERFTKMYAEVPVKEVVAALTSDNWTWTFLPRLTWADVPSLLAIGQDTAFLHTYPRHPLSTYQPDSVRVGLTALWLVEAIRRQARNADRPGALMPPSRAPVLGTRKGNPSGFNSKRQIQSAFAGYEAWWQGLQTDTTKAIRSNPLKGRGMSWM